MILKRKINPNRKNVKPYALFSQVHLTDNLLELIEGFHQMPVLIPGGIEVPRLRGTLYLLGEVLAAESPDGKTHPFQRMSETRHRLRIGFVEGLVKGALTLGNLVDKDLIQLV